MNILQKACIPATIIVVLLLTAQILLSCQLATDGKTIRQIDNEIAIIEKDIALQSEKIASASSLLAVREKAVSMGFQESAAVLTLRQDQFVVALGQTR